VGPVPNVSQKSQAVIKMYNLGCNIISPLFKTHELHIFFSSAVLHLSWSACSGFRHPFAEKLCTSKKLSREKQH